MIAHFLGWLLSDRRRRKYITAGYPADRMFHIETPEERFAAGVDMPGGEHRTWVHHAQLLAYERWLVDNGRMRVGLGPYNQTANSNHVYSVPAGTRGKHDAKESA